MAYSRTARRPPRSGVANDFRAWGAKVWARARSSATVKFAVSSLIVVVLVGVADTAILRRIASNEAVRDARATTRLLGSGVVEPVLTEDVLTGDKAALSRVDDAVRLHVLSDQVMRVKLWDPSGRIVYSDEARLIGSVYPMRDEDIQAFDNEATVSEITNLSRPENRYERSAEKVLEVYFPIHLPDGRPLMFETYMPFSSVAQSSNRLWFAFLAPLVGGLLFLEVVHIPLAWSITRKMRRAQVEREKFLKRAIDSSNLERLRIAADLHDGVVQDLAGISYSVQAVADRIEPEAPSDAASLKDDATTAKQAVRRLRTLLVEIYPPNLQRSGLGAALSDLMSSLQARGIHARLEIEEGLDLSPSVEALLFRAAQESLRNVAAHSGAHNVQVQIVADAERARLTVVDDGRGFAGPEMSETDEGHFGLRLLADLARDIDGNLEIDSRPGAGTTVLLEVPL